MPDLLSMLPEIAVCLLVCFSKMIEISIQSLKTVLMVKGQRFKAACLGFVECLIWGLVVSSIISTLGNNISLLLFYCLGYAVGLFLGSTLEKKIALGTSSIQLIANREDSCVITEYLRKHNRGFTVFSGQGSKDEMDMILIITPRKDVKQILKDVRCMCGHRVFEVTSDVNKFTGGYGIKK